MCFFFLMLRRLPSSTLFPYTTLFRSDGVLGVGRAVGFIGRVEEDAPPREREAVVRLRHVEHHLVLPGDLVQPRFEIGTCGRVAAGGQRLGRRPERGEESAEADCGGAGGNAAQESAPVGWEAA